MGRLAAISVVGVLLASALFVAAAPLGLDEPFTDVHNTVDGSAGQGVAAWVTFGGVVLSAVAALAIATSLRGPTALRWSVAGFTQCMVAVADFAPGVRWPLCGRRCRPRHGRRGGEEVDQPARAQSVTAPQVRLP